MSEVDQLRADNAGLRQRLRLLQWFACQGEDCMATKKASGRNVREDERSTVQTKLRLPPELAEDLDDLATLWGLTRSGAVARLIEESPATELVRRKM